MIYNIPFWHIVIIFRGDLSRGLFGIPPGEASKKAQQARAARAARYGGGSRRWGNRSKPIKGMIIID